MGEHRGGWKEKEGSKASDERGGSENEDESIQRSVRKEQRAGNKPAAAGRDTQ